MSLEAKRDLAAYQLREIPGEGLRDACRSLGREGGRMQMAYAWRREDGMLEARYLADPGASRPFLVWRTPVGSDGVLPSLALLAPLLSWYEREMADVSGLRFTGHPQPVPLLPDAPPASGAAPSGEPARSPRDQWLPEFGDQDLQLLPYGPVRGGVLESAQFLFLYAGEAIVHYQPLLFFKHRAMERRFEGLSPELGAVLAERISGVGSVAHALAFCQAVEDAARCQPPPRALALRSLLAEMERVYNHLHYFGHLSHATSLKVGEAEGMLLEEKAKQINARLTGSRFLRSLLVPGGLRRDLDPAATARAAEAWQALQPRIVAYLRQLCQTRSHLDRLLTNGPLPLQTASDQGATGPVGRASGADWDLRRDHPYAAYLECTPTIAARIAGDANARAEVRAAELETSLDLIAQLAQDLPSGPVRVPCAAAAGSEGLGWSESPRGALFYAVHFGADGRCQRVKIKSPSFSNWRVFPFTVHDTNMMDYAINEASFGLTIAGCAR
ncbi:MAG: nickel-dependent hydrogenase large subunit [Terriglobales bacterium]